MISPNKCLGGGRLLSCAKSSFTWLPPGLCVGTYLLSGHGKLSAVDHSQDVSAPSCPSQCQVRLGHGSGQVDSGSTRI